MKILVTGAAGFLGAILTKHLLEDGFEVTTFDQAEHNIEGAKPIVGDLLDVEALTAALSDHDAICHVGAIGDVYLAGENPQLAASVNVVGCANVAQAALKTQARVVYASTWEVYGTPHTDPVDEEHPCDPDHPYSITKLAGERLLLAADQLNDVPTIALRLGTAYGPGLRPNSVFRIFIDRARKGEPITIQGDGSQFRQFTHADDISRAFALACRSDLRGEVFNTVAADPVTIKQLAELVVNRFPTELSYGESRPGDVHPAMVSSEKAARLLGWKADISFEEGVTRLLDSAEQQ